MKPTPHANSAGLRLRHMQHICGAAFVLLYMLNFAAQVLSLFGISPFGKMLSIVLGACAVVGYVFLFILSSNMASDIFSIGLLLIEAFFAFVFPSLLSNTMDEYTNLTILIYVCGVCAVVAIYLWSVMINSNKFSRSQLRWIALLPLTYFVNFCCYMDTVSILQGHRTLVTGWSGANYFVTPMFWMLMPFMAIGYWKLAHSPAFSSDKDELTLPDLSLNNRFAGAYGTIIILGLIIFNLWK